MRHAKYISLALIPALLALATTWARAANFTVVGSAAKYQNVVKVAKTGPGLRGIQAAIDSISGETSANRFLVEVGPGVFTEAVTMKPWVDIRGAGTGATVISQPGSNDTDQGTVLGADNCTLSHLTVLNTGGSAGVVTHAKAIHNISVSPTLHRLEIRVEAAGVTNAMGVHNSFTASPHMSDLTVLVSGANTNFAILNQHIYTAPFMERVRAEADGGQYAYAVYNSSNCSPKAKGLVCRAGGASIQSVAIYNPLGGSPEMEQVRATADSDGAGTGYALYSSASFPVLRGAVLRATGGGSTRIGLYATNSTITIQHFTMSAVNTSGTAHGAWIRDSVVTLEHFSLESDGNSTTYGLNCADSTLTARQGQMRVYGKDGLSSYGILLDGGVEFKASDLSCIMSATTGTEYGIFVNNNTDATLSNCNIYGADYAVYNYAAVATSNSVQISNSRIYGTTAIYNPARCTTNVGGSMLNGTIANTGALNCYQCFNNNMTAACP